MTVNSHSYFYFMTLENLDNDVRLDVVRARLETFPFGVFSFRCIKDCILALIRTMQGEVFAESEILGKQQILYLQYAAIRMRLVLPPRVVDTIFGIDSSLKQALLCIIRFQMAPTNKQHLYDGLEWLIKAKSYSHHEAVCLRDALDILIQTLLQTRSLSC